MVTEAVLAGRHQGVAEVSLIDMSYSDRGVSYRQASLMLSLLVDTRDTECDTEDAAVVRLTPFPPGPLSCPHAAL